MADNFIDDNSVQDFIDDNSITLFVDDNDVFLGLGGVDTTPPVSNRRYIAFNMCLALLAVLSS
jgi:hypothetical protein